MDPIDTSLLSANFRLRVKSENDFSRQMEIVSDFVKMFELKNCSEFGVRDGNSTVAFMYGLSKLNILNRNHIVLNSYDKDHMSQHLSRELVCLNPNIKHIFHHVDILTITKISHTDILLLDTEHTYNQLLYELCIFNKYVTKFIMIHDTSTFREVGEDGKRGLKRAIDDFFIDNPNWEVFWNFTKGNGLTVLKRKGTNA